MTAMTVGFVGLGNMGRVLAANLVASGHDVVAYDVSGPERCPVGARFAADVAQVAASSSGPAWRRRPAHR